MNGQAQDLNSEHEEDQSENEEKDQDEHEDEDEEEDEHEDEEEDEHEHEDLRLAAKICKKRNRDKTKQEDGTPPEKKQKF